MKTIYVATDFSGETSNSSLYGIALAKAFDARLFMFSAYHTKPAFEPGDSTNQDSLLNPGGNKNSIQAITTMKNKEKDIHTSLGSLVIEEGKQSQLSLLIVPSNANYIYNNFIKVANEEEVRIDASDHILSKLQEIGKNFDSRLYLVH